MKKRIISLVLIVTMLVGILSGCELIPGDDPVPEKKDEHTVRLDKGSVTMYVGDTTTITATVKPDSEGINVRWGTSDSGIVTVKDGVVTAIAKGYATITAELENGDFARCEITVIDEDDEDNDDKPVVKPDPDPDPGDDPSPDPSDKLDEEVTITFYHTMGVYLRNILEDAIDEFEEIYPNINVEQRSYGDYDGLYSQLLTQIWAGTQPNIAYCYPDHVADYNRYNSVLVLDNFMNSTKEITRADGTTEILGLTEEQRNDFVESMLDGGRVYGDGKMYTMPFLSSTEVLYYNKTFFENYGLSVPTTWEEMAEVCEIIKEIDPNSIPLGYDSESNWFITMCEQSQSLYTSSNGENFLFDNEVNHNFVKMLREWYQNGWVTTMELAGGYISNLFTSDSGTKCYMCISSTAGASYHKSNSFEVGIEAIPQVDPYNPKVISQGPSLCIFNDQNSAEVTASWLFVKFLCTNAEFLAQMSMTSGYVPPIKSVIEDPVYQQFLAGADIDPTANITAYAIKVALSQAENFFVPPAFYGSAVAREQVGYLLVKCLAMDAGSDLDLAIRKAFAAAIAECKYQSGQ